jgi:hypothetical protein
MVNSEWGIESYNEGELYRYSNKANSVIKRLNKYY